MARAWQSLAGNFHGSTLIELSAADPPAATLSLAAGLALHDAVSTIAPAASLQLKWPNDLLLGGAKLAGVLLERREQRLVAGFGVNLAAAPELEEGAAASLAIHARTAPEAFVPLLAGAFARRLRQWRGGPLEPLRAEWLRKAHGLGALLRVTGLSGEVISGTFEGLEPEGALRLRLADGRSHVIHAGDVALVGEG